MLAKLSKKADTSLILVFITGLGLSLLAFVYVKNWEQTKIAQTHKEKIYAYVHSLRQALVTIDNVLHSVQGLYNISDDITRENFQEFLIDKKFKQYGIQAIEWIPYIPDSKRDNLEQQMLNEGILDFQIWEYSHLNERQTVFNRNAYYPILFTEPISDEVNAQHLGYDIASNPTLKQALEHARDTGKMVTSGVIQVKEKRGFRSFIPIYQRHTKHQTQAERQQMIRGFVVSLVLFEDLIEDVLRAPKHRTDILLKIVDTTQQRETLYLPSWLKPDNKLIELYEVPLEHGGRSWTLILAALAEQYNFKQFSYAWLVLTIGIIFTLGIWRYLFLTLTRAHWAERIGCSPNSKSIRSQQCIG